MVEHDYPLQALLYSVALHRYLRWRLPGYRPADHLGGVAYLFVRGMTGPDVARERRPAPRRVRVGGAAGAGGRAERPPRRSGRDGAGVVSPSATAARQPVVPDEVAVLAPFVEAGVFGSFEVHLAATMVRLQPDVGDDIILALAIAARAPRFGHVCVDLSRLAEQVDGGWTRRPGPSATSRGPGWPLGCGLSSVLRWSRIPVPCPSTGCAPWCGTATGSISQRYWHDERAVAADLDPPGPGRPGGGGTVPTEAGPRGRPRRPVRSGAGADQPDLQRTAVRRAMTSGVSIIAGGPGTGKTHTVARLLAVAHRMAEAEGRTLDVALAAPTGKAAQRMRDAVRAEVSGLVEPRARSARGWARPWLPPTPPPSTGSSGGCRARGSPTTARTRCRAIWWSSTRPRWCRCR